MKNKQTNLKQYFFSQKYKKNYNSYIRNKQKNGQNFFKII